MVGRSDIGDRQRRFNQRKTLTANSETVRTKRVRSANKRTHPAVPRFRAVAQLQFLDDPEYARREMTKSSDVTQLLTSYRVGDRSLIDELFPLIYDELHGIAHRILSNERSDHTLSTTELVHEAYFKMVDQRRVAWQDRAHFFAIAAQAMRRILVDYARRRNAKKRGGSLQRLPLDESAVAIDLQAGLLVSLDAALDQLKGLNERLAQVVDLRFFGGLTEEEMAEVLSVSARTVRRDWVKARAWLYRELAPDNPKSTESR